MYPQFYMKQYHRHCPKCQWQSFSRTSCVMTGDCIQTNIISDFYNKLPCPKCGADTKIVVERSWTDLMRKISKHVPYVYTHSWLQRALQWLKS